MCSTLLCLRLCSMALGTVPISAVRNTAVPSTRTGGLTNTASKKALEINGVGAQFLVQQASPVLPGQHQQVDAPR